MPDNRQGAVEAAAPCPGRRRHDNGAGLIIPRWQAKRILVAYKNVVSVSKKCATRYNVHALPEHFCDKKGANDERDN